MDSGPEELKLYYDTKSPFAYLAAEPAFALPERFRVALRWIPYLLRIKGPGQRSVYSDWKAKYSYMDARRFANRRGGFSIKGPRKIYDSTPSLIGGLFAEREGFFREYLLETYRRFFEHRLEIDVADEVAALVRELRGEAAEDAYRAFLVGDGPKCLDACVDEGHADHVFGVPIFALRGELFWGHDRMPVLEERLAEYGLAR
jgi:2-hydroxychromene-2-carboxylate isomerase